MYCTSKEDHIFWTSLFAHVMWRWCEINPNKNNKAFTNLKTRSPIDRNTKLMITTTLGQIVAQSPCPGKLIDLLWCCTMKSWSAQAPSTHQCSSSRGLQYYLNIYIEILIRSAWWQCNAVQVPIHSGEQGLVYCNQSVSHFHSKSHPHM